MTVAGQPTVTYGYDDAHRLSSITQGNNVVGFTYDDADRRSTLTYPNGIVGTYNYDDASQLTTLSYALGPAILGDLNYTYDRSGSRIAVGGRWARTGLPQALASASYDASNQIQTWAGQILSHDPDGNLASDGVTSYTWNARNQLTGLSGAMSANFSYDAFGRRRSKTINGTARNFLYDGLNIIQELTGHTPTANLLTGLDVDETFSRTDGSTASTLLIDALGSVLALADTSGSVQTQYTFDAFGLGAASGVTTSNVLQYTGRENDGIGLYYDRARFYHPMFGRFISQDPLDFAAGVNLYAYAYNNPLLYTDPFGLQSGPPDPESQFWNGFGGGASAMWRNFTRMEQRGWKNADNTTIGWETAKLPIKVLEGQLPRAC